MHTSVRPGCVASRAAVLASKFSGQMAQGSGCAERWTLRQHPYCPHNRRKAASLSMFGFESAEVDRTPAAHRECNLKRGSTVDETRNCLIYRAKSAQIRAQFQKAVLDEDPTAPEKNDCAKHSLPEAGISA